MEGIVKQATDSRYWDLWDHQRLSSELELKRRHLLELNQVHISYNPCDYLDMYIKNFITSQMLYYRSWLIS